MRRDSVAVLNSLEFIVALDERQHSSERLTNTHSPGPGMKAREEINELTKYTSQGYSPKCIQKAAKQFATTIGRRLRQRKKLFPSALGRFTTDDNRDASQPSSGLSINEIHMLRRQVR